MPNQLSPRSFDHLDYYKQSLALSPSVLNMDFESVDEVLHTNIDVGGDKLLKAALLRKFTSPSETEKGK